VWLQGDTPNLEEERMRTIPRMIPVVLATLPYLASPAVAQTPMAVTQTMVNVEYEGTKIWLPGTLVVKKGTKVTLKLINKVPSDPKEHGFAIPAYNIAETVVRGEPKTVEFTADKPGIFPIICHLHPAHVGGELVVLE
jgi:heme/copper-type cytochrome/quinol oxidase subunit 2